MSEYVIDMKHISKTYPGVKALSDVQLQIKEGEVHSLVGENGAGKSTLIKLLAGVEAPDDGAEIYINGEKADIKSPSDAIAQGISEEGGLFVPVQLPHFSQGNLILFIDALVITVSAFVYGNIENALYAAICIFMNSKLIDTVLYGMSRNNGKLLFIVTSEYEKVTDAILEKIDRGVTLLKAEGGFRRDDKRVLLVAVRPQQVHRTNVLVHEIDPNAFVINTTANAIKGRGFYAYDEAPNPRIHGKKRSPQETP